MTLVLCQGDTGGFPFFINAGLNADTDPAEKVATSFPLAISSVSLACKLCTRLSFKRDLEKVSCKEVFEHCFK